MGLSKTHEKWLDKRRIDPEVALRYGVQSGSRNGDDGPVEANDNGNILIYPLIDGGAPAATKYRGPNKKFWQKPGGKRTFWNADVMDDPALQNGNAALVITEGYEDALSPLSHGYPFVVSVPDGAPGVPKDKGPEELDPIDPKTENSGKFEFLWNNRDRLKRIKRFIIATDNDPAGRRLAAELVRRLSAVKCSFVTYPEEPCIKTEDGSYRPCKDLNEVLVTFGPEVMLQIIHEAKPYPVRGLYRLNEYPEHEELETYACGFDGWKHYLRPFLGEFMVVSGVPTHGKSTWVINLIANMCSTHNWTAALCTPEMPAVPVLRDRLRRYFIGHKPVALEVDNLRRADDWIGRRFVFIDTDPTGTGDNDDPFDLEWIIEKATDAVLRDGIRILLIDPWNEVEHAKRRDESAADYIARAIRMLKRFARLYGVIVIVVAHPTKDVGKDGKLRNMTLYDIDGAAHWYNKCDHGIVVERPKDAKEGECNIHILKVKFEETGLMRKVPMIFNAERWRYEQPIQPEDLN